MRARARTGGSAQNIFRAYDLVFEPDDGFMDDFLAENPVGLWSLFVSDEGAGDEGQVEEWVLWIDQP